MSAIDQLLGGAVLQRFGWALVHFVWEAAVVVLLAAAVLRLLRSRSANARYVVACGAMLVLASLP